MSLRYVLARALTRQKIRKIARERLTEPVHLNLLAAAVLVFGSYRQRVAFDLAVRAQYAWPILWAADYAKRFGIDKLTLIEFGVANGAGLMNMCELARRTTRATGTQFRIVGFDSGAGLPPAKDYRDHPEVFQASDYPMLSPEALSAALPSNAELVLGPINDTVEGFLATVADDCPIGLVALDVDYYSSAKDALRVLEGRATQYLPVTPVYLDDIEPVGCNPWTGEYLAVNEFNAETTMRKIAPFNFLRAKRIFKNAGWIDRMYAAHFHDHPARQKADAERPAKVLKNEYVGL